MKTLHPCKKRYKACILDLDGTVVNTLYTVLHYCNRTLHHFGFQDITEDSCRNLCRLPIGEFYHELLRLGGCPESQVPQLAPAVRDFDIAAYSQDPTPMSLPYDGMEALLSELRHKGIVLGILTNKPHGIASALIDKLLPGLFHSVRGQTPDTISKPDPRALLDYIAFLGLEKADCLYVGDTDVDMKTAKAAQVDVAAVTWGFQPKVKLLGFDPEFIVDNPKQLLELYY